MNWLHILYAFVASAILASFTDWYFFGVLFHEHYDRTPGAWRKYRDKKDEIASILISQVIFGVSSFVFILACGHLGLTSLSASLLAAVTVWIMIPLPLLAVNAIFMNIDRMIVVSHALGWLARLVITALFVTWLLY
jgi:Protein of unknown function (DUF1761)